MLSDNPAVLVKHKKLQKCPKFLSLSTSQHSSAILILYGYRSISLSVCLQKMDSFWKVILLKIDDVRKSDYNVNIVSNDSTEMLNSGGKYVLLFFFPMLHKYGKCFCGHLVEETGMFYLSVKQ